MKENKINDGGPAFPGHHYFDPSRGQYGEHMTASDVGCGGMSLRDWFAGQVAGGMAAFSGTAGVSYGPGDIAGRAYQVADAMLAERAKTGHKP